jgi:hypothetical protein
MTISYPLRPPQPNRFEPVTSRREPRNTSPNRTDVELNVSTGETPKVDANAMVGPRPEGSE